SVTPAPGGSAMPSAAGTSPAKSTMSAPPTASRERSSPRAVDTTVVPLPPFTDQQAMSTSPPGRERARQGEGNGGSIRAVGGADKAQSRPYPRLVGSSA